jgi:hypothetical protein
MSVISTSDFNNWKQDSVTEAFMQVVYERMEDCKNHLSVTAGLDSIEDNKTRGYLLALRDILQLSFDDVQEEV